jgi:hypothetical protein
MLLTVVWKWNQDCNFLPWQNRDSTILISGFGAGSGSGLESNIKWNTEVKKVKKSKIREQLSGRQCFLQGKTLYKIVV